MANLFDSANAPTTEPEKLTIGDFIQWKRIDLGDDYPNTSYTLVYSARLTSGGESEISATATASGEDYLITIPSTTSINYKAGDYRWQAEIVRNSDSARIVIDRGYFEVVADLDDNAADLRSHAEIMVDKIESLLQGKADSDVANYSVAGRSLTKLSFRELIDARDYYMAEVVRQKQKENISKGKASGSTIKVRFL